MICLVADIFASSISSTFSYTTSVSDIEWRNVEESNILSAKPRPPVRFSIRELNPKLFREQKNDLWKRMEKTVAWKELVTTISAFFIKPKNSFGQLWHKWATSMACSGTNLSVLSPHIPACGASNQAWHRSERLYL